jgi:anti-sigma regulatory factor (Ser/Thr protein kinase)
VSIDVGADDGVLSIRFEDSGRPFDPASREDPDVSPVPAEERDVGGLGIFMVKRLMDEVSYKREGGKNVLVLRKRVSQGDR